MTIKDENSAARQFWRRSEIKGEYRGEIADDAGRLWRFRATRVPGEALQRMAPYGVSYRGCPYGFVLTVTGGDDGDDVWRHLGLSTSLRDAHYTAQQCVKWAARREREAREHAEQQAAARLAIETLGGIEAARAKLENVKRRFEEAHAVAQAIAAERDDLNRWITLVGNASERG